MPLGEPKPSIAPARSPAPAGGNIHYGPRGNPNPTTPAPYYGNPNPLGPNGQPMGPPAPSAAQTAASNNPYFGFANGQIGALFGDQAAQNQYLVDQFNSQTAPRLGLAQGDLQGNYANNSASLQAAVDRNYNNGLQNQNDLFYANQQFGNQQGYFSALRQFNGRDTNLINGQAGNLGQLAQRQFGIGSGRNQLAYDQQARADMSSATGRGAVGSLGYRQDISANTRNRDLSQAGTQLDLDSARNNIKYNQDQGLLGIDRSNASINNQDASSQTAHNKAQSDAQVNQNIIDSLSREYGVNATQLQGAFDRGMKKLGLDASAAQSALAEAQRQGNASAVAAYMQILQQALSYAGQ